MSKRRRDKRLQAFEWREWRGIKGLNKISFWEMDPSTISQEIRYKPHFLGIYKTCLQNWGFWAEIHIAPKGTYIKAFHLCHGVLQTRTSMPPGNTGNLGWGMSFRPPQTRSRDMPFHCKIKIYKYTRFFTPNFYSAALIHNVSGLGVKTKGRKKNQKIKKKEITTNLLKMNRPGDLTSTRFFSPQ